MDKESNRNTIIFMVCTVVLLFGYETFIMGPAAKRQQAAAQAQAAAMAKLHPQTNGVAAATAGAFMPRAQVVAQNPRLAVDTPSLAGSINLRGALIDDLYLKTYHQTVDPKSPSVELLRPAGVEHAWFADVGWTGSNVPGTPDLNTIWTATPGAKLTPTSPVALTYDNGHGLVFHRLIAVDDHYMFAISDTVTNTTNLPIVLQSFGSVQQHGLPSDLANSGIIHEGAIGILGGQLTQSKYKSWKKDGREHLHGRLAGHHPEILADRADPRPVHADPGRVPSFAVGQCRQLRGRLHRTAADHRAGRQPHRHHPRLRRRQGGADAEGL